MKWLVYACLGGTIASAIWRACRHERPAACELPPRDCTEGCADLVQFLFVIGPGYFDDVVFEESSRNTSTSYVRRDLMMLVKYATARVACDAATWRSGNGARLGLGDGSEIDGSIPGTSYGHPRHPRNTHEDGYDIDIAYYQRGTQNNSVRAVCPTESEDAFHCTGKPNLLDARRTALFIGTLYESDRVRIVGIDGMVAKPIHDQISRMCRNGLLTIDACKRIRLGYETEPTGRQWFYGHHNHLHLSLKR